LETYYPAEAADLIAQLHSRGVLDVATPEERADLLRPMVQWMAEQDVNALTTMSEALRSAITGATVLTMRNVPLLDALCTYFTPRVRRE
jgi:hypothetical protein